MLTAGPRLAVASTLFIALAAAIPLCEGEPDGPAALPPRFPEKLSQTDLYESLADKKVSPRLQPYEVNVGFWSDGAVKERYLVLPAGERASFEGEHLRFPVGTRFVQTLFYEAGGERVYLETRVIEIIAEQRLDFATYVWNEEQTDATLNRDGDHFYVRAGGESQLWEVGSRRQCIQCHNRASGLILGATTRQLNRDVAAGGATVPQLEALRARGVVSALPSSPSRLPRQVDAFDETRPLEARARSYLDANCAACHRPGGRGSGTLDLRLETPMHETGLIKLGDGFDLDGGVLVPGDGRGSMLVGRMATVSRARMPQFLTTVPDDRGVKLVSDWIDSK